MATTYPVQSVPSSIGAMYRDWLTNLGVDTSDLSLDLGTLLSMLANAAGSGSPLGRGPSGVSTGQMRP